MMKSLPMTSLEQLRARLHEQALDVIHLREALDLQMNRISHLYDHEGLTETRERCSSNESRQARLENYTISAAGTGIRGRSTVKTHPFSGRL
jgi:predicted metalloenzyme YecM